MPVTGPITGFTAKDSNTGLSQDLGQRYVSKDYLIDVYPNIASTLGSRTSPGLFMCGLSVQGEIGNGTTISYSSPIQVGSSTNWKQVAGSLYSSLALKTDGTLWAWGDGTVGQLGNGTILKYSSPIQIGSLTTWTCIGSSLLNNGAAIKTDGTLWTWGNNINGQLGNGTTVSRSSPIQIGAMTNWKHLSTGGQTDFVAIKTDGTLWAWGFNNIGQLGNGTTINYSSPIQIGSLTNWKRVSLCQQSSAAIKTDGTLWCWGFGTKGSLGNGTTINYSSPIQVGSLTNWNQVCCSNEVTFAIKTDGTLWAWGFNHTGQLGNGTTINYSSPIQIGSLTNWKYLPLSGGQDTIAVIKTDGTLWSWGSGWSANLGNGTTISYSSPIQVGSLTTWKHIGGTFYNLSAISDGYI